MAGSSHNSRTPSHARVKHALSIRCAVFIALALCAGSHAQTPAVQAAQVTESVFFTMHLRGNPKTTLCAGRTYTYHVEVAFAPEGRPTPTPGPLGKLPGVNMKVEADSSNRSAGDFTEREARTYVSASEELGSLVTANFPFKANQPGKTTLWFQGLVQDEYVSLNHEVRVINCKFKTATIGEWRVPGEANIHIMATSADADVKAADADSPSFTGSASVSWVGSLGRVEDCAGTITIGNSQVNWTGTMDESDQLTLDANYQTAAGSMDAECVGDEGSTSGSMQIELTPDPIQLTVASSGGVFRQAQVLQGPEETSGFVTIIVLPEEDAAVAISPRHDETHIGALSPWWAMLWDGFSLPYSTLP